MVESERDLAEETHSVLQVWEQISELLCLRSVSVDNRTKHNVHRAVRPVY